MKASIYTEYGPPEVLHLAEVVTPIPTDVEVLVRVHATHVNFGDVMARNFKAVTPAKFNMPAALWLPSKLAIGVNKPRQQVLGSEFSGQVEAVGKEVTRFKPGDTVFGYRGSAFGAYAEYLCMKETGSIALKPTNMSNAEACTIPYGALMAMGLLGKIGIQSGQKVLVIGASGGIGAIAMQLAQHWGAEVTAVGGTQRIEMLRALGADHVIDYTKDDFTQNGETYDVIVDILGKGSFDRYEHSLASNGFYLPVSFKSGHLAQMVRTRFAGGKKVICALAPERAENLESARQLAEAGALRTVIDRTFPLGEAAEAHRYYESGARLGNVVITVES
jgi:NADPH:quinone reductase-like Zn-dependent oxidoreductase